MKLPQLRNGPRAITLNSRWREQSSFAAISCGTSRRIGTQMTAVIYKFERSGEGDSIDETERLFAALGRYTSAELLELLYVGEEPGFFELVRGLFALSDESRLILHNFLAAAPPHTTTAAVDREGRLILAPGNPENRRIP
jgi:hypothetical protein